MSQLEVQIFMFVDMALSRTHFPSHVILFETPGAWVIVSQVSNQVELMGKLRKLACLLKERYILPQSSAAAATCKPWISSLFL